MVGIILATHGGFSEGILQSATMLFGEQENIKAITLMPENGPADVRAKMEEAVASFDDPEQVLILVDIWGGTPFNQANGYISGHEDKWAIVSGLNLPMLIEACGARFDPSATAQDIASMIVKSGRDGIKTFPESIMPPEAAPAAAAAPAAPQGAIPEGTVLGDGKIKFGLARIDTRLLHGQVATAWTKAVAPDRIIAVSDAVAADDLRKQMIMEAAPPGVKAHVIPIWKMCEIAKDPRFGDTKAMLLFETPQDALKAIEGGVDIEVINVGSMAHTKGKVAVNKVLSFGKDDVKAFLKLKKLGVKFDVRKVPSDSAENIDDILKNAKDGLGME